MLIKAGREVREPFVLSVQVDNGRQLNITILEILRLLPGRRIVALAEDSDRKLLIKLFIGRFANRYKKREARGVEAIEQAGVKTPALLWQGRLSSGGGYVLAFDFLDECSSLVEKWRTLTGSKERRSLLADIMPVLARLHDHGVVQNDIHPGNFLIKAGTIYTIDGGDVSGRMASPLNEAASIENLALFFAQFLARFDDLVPEALAIYSSERGWPTSSGRCDVLKKAIRKSREIRKSGYIEKAFRECTRFSCLHTLTRFVVCERKHDSTVMRTLLGNLDQAIEKGRILKDGNTATVALIDGPQGPLVVKRYNIKSVIHRLQRMFRKSRAWMSWANTSRLEFLGIDTLKPVALVENRLGPLRGKAYFVTEYVEGPDATSLAGRENPERDMSSIVDILNGLFQAGVTHGDLKASNFLLASSGTVIIDLDSMKEHSDKQHLEIAVKKDLDRFMKNWDAPMNRKFAELIDGTFHF